MLTYLRFKWQRVLRRHHRAIKKNWRMAVSHVRTNVWAKWRQLTLIRRFAIMWWAIMALAGVGLFLQVRGMVAAGAVLRPVAGGVYTEAVVGDVKTVNPILPDNSASADATRLVFDGLTRFSAGGKLLPGLAENWSVSADGKSYTFKLRKGVKWHDGVPFTSQDVAFTLTAIQNPDTRSPLAANWQGVQIATPDDHTVIFTLPKAYTPFVNATTVGILPRHRLENIEPREMRVATFNQQPVGTGPFQLKDLDPMDKEIIFIRNDDYFGGKPLLEGVVLRWYDDSKDALAAYARRQVQGVARLQPSQREAAMGLGGLKIHEAGLPDQVAVFFNVAEGLLADKAVRTALAQATDRRGIVDKEFGGQASALAVPLVYPGLDLQGSNKGPAYSTDAAKTALQSAGWVEGEGGIRIKDGKKLQFEIVTQSDTPYVGVARRLKEQWKKAGAEVVVRDVDATELQQSNIRPRHYDALLYGINSGADPDVYAFWHSSQVKDPGLNLSAYASKSADVALESGRTLRDTETRYAKYRSFVQAWSSDVPAVMLYTPTYLYAVDRDVHGVDLRRLVTPSDRFDNIASWSVRVKAVPAR